MDSSRTVGPETVELRLAGVPVAWGSEVELAAGAPPALSLHCGPDVPRGGAALGLQLDVDADPEDLPSGYRAVVGGEPVGMESLSWGVRSARREWQQQFAARRYVGETLVMLTEHGQPVAGAEILLRFRLDDADQARYDYMRAALSAQDRRAVRELGGIVALRGGEAGATPRSRLEARWDAIRKAHEGLGPALRPILSSPHTALSYAHDTIEWSEQMGAADLSGSSPAPGTPWMRVPARAGLAVTRLPRRFTRPHVELRYDVPANRYVRDTVDLLINEARSLERDAGKLAEDIQTRLAGATHRHRRERLERALDRCRNLAAGAHRLRQRSVASWLTTGFLGSVRPAKPSATDLVWRDNTYYRRVRLIRHVLDAELRAAEDALLDNDMVTPYASINELYELWMTMLLLDTLCTRLDCRLLAKGGRPVVAAPDAQPSYLLNRGSSAELRAPSGKRLVVRFDQEYPALTVESDYRQRARPPAYGVDRRVWAAAKGRPDIALEVWDDASEVRVPKIIVCDVTWSVRLDTQVTKFLYREAIRDFTTTGASGQPGRPVVASWVVYPGAPAEVDYEDDYRTGRLPLAPDAGAGAALAGYLEPLLALAEGL
ncbi:MAG: hypothetical protein ACR2M0_01930 [Chloroflexia bacterium]